MRKKMTLAAGLAAGLLTVAMCTTAFAAQITADKAEATALKDAGIKKEDTAFIRTEVDYEDGRQIYDVSFLTNNFVEYDYDIDAADGSIVAIDYDAETTFYNNQNASKKAVTLAQAKETALNHAGKKASEVTVVKERTGYDDGRQLHEIEFYAGVNEKYEYEIDAATGGIFKWDYKASKSNVNGISQNTQTGISTAKATALKTAGLKDSQVRWGNVHQDYDDGRMVYEGKFFYNALEYDFEIDAATGNVIDWDVESIYD